MSEEPMQTITLPHHIVQRLEILSGRMGTNVSSVVDNLISQKVLETAEGEPQYTPPAKVTESSRHRELKQIAKQYLQVEYGFKPSEIFFEYGASHVRVDVAGIGRLKVAVEVGHCSVHRLFALHGQFDQVVWIPYWLDIVTGEASLGTIVRREARKMLKEEMKHRFTPEVHELMKQNRELEQLVTRIASTILMECTDNGVKAKIAPELEKALGRSRQIETRDLRN